MGPGLRQDDAGEHGDVRAERWRDIMKTPRNFSDVETWVFDLDNTLYPHHVNLWQQVDARSANSSATG
jgi:hypothetical protein